MQNNKSRSQVVQLGPELQKVEGEIRRYRRFVELCGEIVQANEQICRLRPVREVSTSRVAAAKKNFAAEVQQEAAQEIRRLLGRLTRSASSWDLGAAEMAIRSTVRETYRAAKGSRRRG